LLADAGAVPPAAQVVRGPAWVVLLLLKVPVRAWGLFGGLLTGRAAAPISGRSSWAAVGGFACGRGHRLRYGAIAEMVSGRAKDGQRQADRGWSGPSGVAGPGGVGCCGALRSAPPRP